MIRKLKNFWRFKLKLKHKFGVLVFFIFLFFLAISYYFDTRINPVIITMSEAKVTSLSTTAVYEAIDIVLSNGTDYSDLINVTTNSEGEVNFLQADGISINALGNQIAVATQLNLDKIGQQTVSIPIGNFTGMPILAGQGPRVEIKLLPIGNVNCKFVSEFTNAGINQTNHRIYMFAETKISLVLPMATRIINSSIQILLCESIIIGKVPATYLNATDLDSMLNLIG